MLWTIVSFAFDRIPQPTDLVTDHRRLLDKPLNL